MGKNTTKDPLPRARKKVARAQERYMKAVAKGEREIRNIRAKADERIARAKAEFELRASELADIEQNASPGTASSPAKAAEVVEIAALEVVKPEPEVVVPNGKVHRATAPKGTPRKRTTTPRQPKK